MPKKYGELRYRFVRGLRRQEKKLFGRSYQMNTALTVARAITSLGLLPLQPPVKSVTAAKEAVVGIGDTVKKLLKDISAKDGPYAQVPEHPPAPGQFICSAPAILVAMLQAEADTLVGDDTAGMIIKEAGEEIVLLRKAEIIRRAAPLSEEGFNPIGEDTGKRSDCMAWNRIYNLIQLGLVKQRTKQKQPAYQLLDCGRVGRGKVVGAIDLAERLANPNRAVVEQRHAGLYGSDSGQDGIVLLVDDREGGGDRLANLKMLCDSLQRSHRIIFRTAELSCGDYMWVQRRNKREYVIPIIMERKRADDFAASMRGKNGGEGRLAKQQKRMLRARADFGVKRLIVVVEGEVRSYVLATCCNRRCVGKCGGPTQDEVEAAINNLEVSPEFQLLRTKHLSQTIDLLEQLTMEIRSDIDRGSLQAIDLELDEFQLAMNPRRKKSKATFAADAAATVVVSKVTHTAPALVASHTAPASHSAPTLHSPATQVAPAPLQGSSIARHPRPISAPPTSYAGLKEQITIWDDRPASKTLPCKTQTAPHVEQFSAGTFMSSSPTSQIPDFERCLTPSAVPGRRFRTTPYLRDSPEKDTKRAAEDEVVDLTVTPSPAAAVSAFSALGLKRLTRPGKRPRVM